MELRNETSWVLPGVLLTVALGASSLILMPNYSGVLPALALLWLWLIACALIAAVYVFVAMMRARIERPIHAVARAMTKRWRDLLLVAGGIVLAGLNMVAFMWTKPLLNYFVPFGADPFLADLDYMLFLGHDPWTLLGWLNTMPLAIFYHRGWFALMLLTLLIVLSSPASAKKSALMTTYFILWSIVGPLIHTLLPAAGPIFYEKLGYGDRFAGIMLPDEMVRMSDYLWSVYTTDQFGPGSGISAMPSLHIATMAWMVMATYVLGRALLWPIAAAGALIFLLSISLGWHYAIDGIVGAAAALGSYILCLRFYEGRIRWSRGGARVGPIGAFSD